MKKYRIVQILLPLFIFFACVNSEDYQKVKEDFKDVDYDNNWDSFDSIYAGIPEYSQIEKTISSLHTKFNSDILLDPAGADFYFNSKETSVALGMYTADLGYVRYFERVQLCAEYLESVRLLAEKLAVGEKEFNETVPKIESNLDDNQKLFALVDSLLSKGNVFLGGNEKYGISALFLGGFWIETTYIGLNSGKDSKQEDLEEILVSHFKILSEINKLFACLEDDSVLKELKTDLVNLEKKGPANENLLTDLTKIREKFINQK